jgi:hypothetical protein
MCVSGAITQHCVADSYRIARQSASAFGACFGATTGSGRNWLTSTSHNIDNNITNNIGSSNNNNNNNSNANNADVNVIDCRYEIVVKHASHIAGADHSRLVDASLVVESRQRWRQRQIERLASRSSTQTSTFALADGKRQRSRRS